MHVRKRPWVFVCLCCVRVCCGDYRYEIACVCVCVFVRAYVDALNKKTMGFRVYFLHKCVFWGPPVGLC